MDEHDMKILFSSALAFLSSATVTAIRRMAQIWINISEKKLTSIADLCHIHRKGQSPSWNAMGSRGGRGASTRPPRARPTALVFVAPGTRGTSASRAPVLSSIPLLAYALRTREAGHGRSLRC